MVNKNSINLNLAAKVPMIRMEVYANNSFSNSGNGKWARKVDITVADKSHNGRDTVEYIRQYISAIP